MNAPGFRAPQRADYEPTVRAFMPGVEGEELDLRCSLLLIRDRAMSAMTYCTDEAHGLLEHIHRLASTYAFASMSLDELRGLRRILLLTTSNASALQVWMNDFAYAGGTDARGG